MAEGVGEQVRRLTAGTGEYAGQSDVVEAMAHDDLLKRAFAAAG
jgi:hypothetical protein